MLVILSPSKQIECFKSNSKINHSLPEYTKEAAFLIDELRKMSVDDIAHLMKVSDNLARLNYDRIFNWTTDVNFENASLGIHAFMGDAYRGLLARDFSLEELESANVRLRILSGLYGVVRPFDLIMPYRLEMGIKHGFGGNRNLYIFWGDKIRLTIEKAIEQSPGEKVLINLASNEYAKSVDLKKLKKQCITPVFKQEVNGQLKIVALYAKRARGMMTRFIIQNELNEVEHIKAFDAEGYYFNAQLSNEREWVFIR